MSGFLVNNPTVLVVGFVENPTVEIEVRVPSEVGLDELLRIVENLDVPA